MERLDRRQAVRHWVLVPAFAGSNPAGPATHKKKAFRSYFCASVGAVEYEPKVRIPNEVRDSPILPVQPFFMQGKPPLIAGEEGLQVGRNRTA